MVIRKTLFAALESQVLQTTTVNVLLGGLGVLTGLIAARLLGPQGRGELGAVQVWTGFLATIAMMGLPDALVYYSAKEPASAGRYMGSAMAIALVATLPIACAGFSLYPLVLSAQRAEIVFAARWYLLLIPLTALVGLPHQILRGLGKFSVWNLLRLAPVVVWLAILICAWLFQSRDVPLLCYSYLVGLALCIPLFVGLTWRATGRVRFDAQNCYPLLRYGLPSLFGSVPLILNLRMDQMLMASFVPAEMLGQYVVGVSWSSVITPLLNGLASVLFPRVASQANRETQVSTLVRGSRIGVLIAICLALLVGLITPLVLPLLFGRAFESAVFPALILVGASAIAAINLILEEGLRGLGYPKAVMYAELVGLAVTGVALWILLPSFGIVGAAIASVLGYSAIMGLLVGQGHRLTGKPIPDFLFPTKQDLISSLNLAHRLRQIGD